ncbi:hypothetical protein [Micromonospora haikouensis]
MAAGQPRGEVLGDAAAAGLDDEIVRALAGITAFDFVDAIVEQ